MGTAGSGKTTLVEKFGEWIEGNRGTRVSRVNLDPGAEFLPYAPDFDVRNTVRVEEIMRSEGLGPNGALLRAFDVIAQRAGEICDEIVSAEGEIKLIDMPGQSEVFIFHGSGSLFLEALSVKAPTIAVFLIDSSALNSAANFVALLMLAVSVQVRVGVPMVYAVSKSDVLSEGVDPERLLRSAPAFKRLIRKTARGVSADVSYSTVGLLLKIIPRQRMLKVSAVLGRGMRELYDTIHEAFCVCGDLT